MSKKNSAKEGYIFAFFILLGSILVYFFTAGIREYNIAKQKSASITISPRPTVFVNKIPYTEKTDIFISATDSGYTPNVIHVKKNYLVIVHLHTSEGYHNFVLPEYGINSLPLATDKSDIFSFVSTTSGSFTFFSQPKDYQTKNIQGILVVE